MADFLNWSMLPDSQKQMKGEPKTNNSVILSKTTLMFDQTALKTSTKHMPRTKNPSHQTSIKTAFHSSKHTASSQQDFFTVYLLHCKKYITFHYIYIYTLYSCNFLSTQKWASNDAIQQLNKETESLTCTEGLHAEMCLIHRPRC